MMKHFFILVGAFTAVMGWADGENQWQPAQHPAQLERTITGFTEPVRRMQVAAEFGGRLLAVAVQEGMVIQPSSGAVHPQRKDWFVVGQLDDRLVQREQATVLAERRTAEATLDAQVAQLALARREAAFEQQEVDRIAALATSGKVPIQQLDRVKFQRDRANLQVKRVEADVAVQKQTVASFQERLEAIVERRRRYLIHAPVGWTVESRLREPGAWLNGGDALYNLVDLRQLKVRLRLSESEVKALGTNGVELTWVQSGHRAVAELFHISNTFDPVTRKREVELRVKGDGLPEVSGGLEVSVRIRLPYPGNAVMIPTTFIKHELEQKYVITTDGKSIPILPLRVFDNYVIVDAAALDVNSVLVKPAPMATGG